jgi:hypothetical protein
VQVVRAQANSVRDNAHAHGNKTTLQATLSERQIRMIMSDRNATTKKKNEKKEGIDFHDKFFFETRP